MTGIGAELKGRARIVTLPVQNVLQTLPFGKTLFSKDGSRYLAERAANTNVTKSCGRLRRSPNATLSRYRRIDSV
ncbi:MAG: hypothetical protein CMJ64_22190 [Planctomycetaceae bacterium]|nr:hypothetical protein [Planctomycetaceae bacterium]